jgi:hypothetical protein
MLRNFRVVAALSFVCFVSVVGANGAQIDFSDDFNSGASPLWGNELGNWVATSGVYYALAPRAVPDTYTSLPFVINDYTLDVDINSISDGGIWVRSANQNNGLLLVTGGASGASTGLYWDKFVNGSLVQWRGNPVSNLFQPGDDIHLRIVASNDTFNVYLNAGTTPVSSYVDSTWNSGFVGLYANSSQTFDNFTLAANSVPEPSFIVLLAASAIGLLAFGWRRFRS